MKGVYATRSAWAGPREVVHVTYDPQLIGYDKLLENAKRMECTSAVYTFDAEQKKLAQDAGLPEIVEWEESLETRQVKKAEQKYYLRNTVYGFLPLTELQAVKINVAVSPLHDENDAKVDPQTYLSPRQKKLLARIQRVLKQDSDSLAGFGFPEDQAHLIEYGRKLETRLKELEK